MKKIVCCIVLISSLGFGQYFSSNLATETPHFDSESNFPNDPDMGVDADGESPPAEDDVPIDEYTIFLVIIGIAFFSYAKLKGTKHLS